MAALIVGRGEKAISKDIPHIECGVVVVRACCPSLRRRFDAAFPAPLRRAAARGVVNGVLKEFGT